jgi:hypothetical protein
MNLTVSSWPAAAVIIALVVLAVVFVVVLGLYSPVTLGTLGAAVGALLLGQARPALSLGQGDAPKPTGAP